MSTNRFTTILVACGIGGAAVGTLLGCLIGNIVPEAYADVCRYGGDPASVGMAYGLGQGLVVGLLIGAFFIFIRAKMTGKDPAAGEPQPVLDARRQSKINWFRVASLVIAVPVSLYCLMALFLYFSFNKPSVRASPKKEGLSIRYYGFRPIMIVGFDNSSHPGGIYTLREPKVYDFKTFGDIVPWNSLVPADPEDGKAALNSSATWRVLYLELREGEIPRDN